MKLRDLLKHFEHLDLDTEIYTASAIDDDGERYLSANISIGSMLAIPYPAFDKDCIVPDKLLNRHDKDVIEVVVII